MLGPWSTSGSPVARSITLWPVFWMTSPTPLRCMMLMAPLKVIVPATKFGHDRKVVVLVQREPSDAVDVVRGVVDVFDSPERVPVGVEPNLRAVVEEVDEVVVERPGWVECGAVDRVGVLEVELKPLRCGRSGGPGAQHKHGGHEGGDGDGNGEAAKLNPTNR